VIIIWSAGTKMTKTGKTPGNSKTDALNAQSAYKALEMVLYNLSSHVSESISNLENKTQNADNATKINISHLKESIGNLEMFVSDTLNKKTVQNELNQFDPTMVERINVEKVLRTLAQTSSSENSQEFLNYCVKNLADFYGCQFAFIGLIKESKKEVRTIAVWAGDKIVDNFEYLLEGTPCADIINMDKELIPEDASKLYSEDEMLIQMGIDSYYGSPLLTTDKGVIGLVSVMDVKPMRLNEWTAPTLGVFASRITLEIQRNNILDDLKNLNETLEARVKSRTSELERINNELAAFSYSVSHDLRAPVRTINSFTEIIKEDHINECSNELSNLLNRIENAGHRLDEIIDGLLSLTSITNNKLLRKKINLSQLIDNEIDSAISSDEDKRTIKTNIQPDVYIWGDEKLISIAIQNLVSNAYKYTSKENATEISFGISANGDNNQQTFYIKDNGAGFDIKQSKNLFKPFSRLHSDKDFAGVGIGLATTKKIFERHNGDIWAESNKGIGSTFYFHFGDSKPIN